MRTAITESSQGLRRAERNFAISADRISKLDLPMEEGAGRGQAPDTVAIDGVARPRLYASRTPQPTTIGGEIINMKRAELAYRANLSTLETSLEMEESILAMDEEEEE
jgi:hypothetical protein